MALNSISPSSLNKKAEFGKWQTVHNDNTGANIKKFVPAFTLWCMPYTRSISQQVSLTPEQLDQPIIVVRHNRNIEAGMLVRYLEKVYSIVNISSDDSNHILTYDYVTLKKMAK